MTPKVYEFMEETVPRLLYNESSSVLGLQEKEGAPFTPRINFPTNKSMLYCRSNSTLVDSTMEYGGLNFFQPRPSPTHSSIFNFDQSIAAQSVRNLTPCNQQSRHYLNHHQPNQRSCSSIGTFITNKKEAQSVIYRTGSFNNQSCISLQKPPRFLSSRVIGLTSSHSFE